MASGPPWTAEDRAALVRMAEAGARQKDIARALGRSPDAIRTQLFLIRAGRDQPIDGRGRGRLWKPEDDAVLIAAHRAGQTMAQIAARLGRTEPAIRHRTLRLRDQGIDLEVRSKGPAKVNWDDGFFARLWACERIGTAAIAAHYGVSPSAVRHAAKARGWPPRADAYASRRLADRETFARMWAFGVPVKEIGRVLRISPRTIHNLRDRLGLPPRERIAGQGWVNRPLSAFLETELAARMRAAAE